LPMATASHAAGWNYRRTPGLRKTRGQVSDWILSVIACLRHLCWELSDFQRGLDYLKVTDIHSKRTDTRRRFRATLRWVARLVLISIVGSWLFLYIDSVYQRRRAESLFADLRALDFSTAGFAEVRDIMVRSGWHGIPPESLTRFPGYLGTTNIDAHGNVAFQWRPGPTCTPRFCNFLLLIMTGLPRIRLPPPVWVLPDTMAQFFYATLPYIGVHSWVVSAWFEVRNGKLERSQTAVSEIRIERLDSSGHRYLVPDEYAVETQRDAASFVRAACSGQDYHVYVSQYCFAPPANYASPGCAELRTCVLQSAGEPLKRAFDVHLRCLNGLLRSCRFDELAPSAWADHSAKDQALVTRTSHLE
jgi:hypothetical protein